jgi:hypothetical protein
MVATRAAKRAVADCLNPLNHTGILQQVCDLVGPGEYIFLALVNKLFRACSLKVPQFDGVDLVQDGFVEVSVLPATTRHEAVFASLPRLQLALQLGFQLQVQAWGVQLRAGWYADTATLHALHEVHGMPWTAAVACGAAASGSVSRVQYLLDDQQCPQGDGLCNFAAIARSTDVIKWLRQRGAVFTAETCANAARSAKAAAMLQYLYEQGAPWDADTMTVVVGLCDMPLLQWLQAKVLLNSY